MKLLVAADEHIYRTKDGKYWSKNIARYSFWTRYLNVFDDVCVVARVKDIEEKTESLLRVDGPHVEVYGIPFYQGPIQLLKKYFKIRKVIKNIDNSFDAALFRMPSQTAQMVYQYWNKNIPFAGEIVINPHDELARLSFKNPILLLLNYIISIRLKKFCMKANGVSYVTQNAIQKYYPSRSHIEGESQEYFNDYFSTITMCDSAFYKPRKFLNSDKEKILTISDVAMNSDRKGISVLLYVAKKVLDTGYKIKVIVIGDGFLRKKYEELAKKLKIYSNVEFKGLLSTPEQVQQILKITDLFVLPTKSEGLPRGILEAMAMGVPVLSTPVGGIPEIIGEEYLFDPLDINGFAEKICYLLDNPSELERMSWENYNKSLEYNNKKLQKRRDEFYKKLRKLAENKKYN